ncbi:sugar ABC transporter substrate-binding protein [Spirochaetia bacterium]|nr:sugar ABC transporter substrate-binding protein [Spirochaetia bacterium]
MGFAEKSCVDFVSVLASKEPVPGGGGASALVGAIGAALGNMVGSLTVGKKKYADVEADIIRLKKASDKIQGDFLTLVQRDAEAFAPLAKAYGLPKETEAEKAEKTKVMEAALKVACSVPMDIMRKCGEAIKVIEEFAAKGSSLAISDAGVGVLFCKAALTGASLNVFINTAAMTDKPYAEQVNREANALLAEYEPLADKIFKSVKDRLK